MSRSNFTLVAIVAALGQLRTELDKVPAPEVDTPEAGLPNYIRQTSKYTVAASVREDLEPISFHNYVNKYLNDTIAAVSQGTQDLEDSELFEDVVRNFLDVEEDVTQYILEFGPRPDASKFEFDSVLPVDPKFGPRPDASKIQVDQDVNITLETKREIPIVASNPNRTAE